MGRFRLLQREGGLQPCHVHANTNNLVGGMKALFGQTKETKVSDLPLSFQQELKEIFIYEWNPDGICTVFLNDNCAEITVAGRNDLHGIKRGDVLYEKVFRGDGRPPGNFFMSLKVSINIVPSVLTAFVALTHLFHLGSRN